jgi:hypothetical protein
LFKQLKGSSDPSGARADYSNFLAALFGLNFRDVKLAFFQLIIAEEPMQLPDSQGAIDLGACTFPFTGMMADPAADPGKRMLLFEEL